MNIEFDILFTLQLKHNYFADGKLKKVAIDITPGTKIKLNNNGLLFKPFNDGFRILYDKNFAGQKRTREMALDGITVLRFHLTLNDSDFFNYTGGISKEIISNLFYFHNIPGTSPQSFSSTVLHEEELVTDSNLVSESRFTDLPLNKPFGVLDVRLNEDLSPLLTIHFGEKKTYWRYVIAGNHLLNLKSPAILGEEVNFVGPERIVLPDAREAITFESPAPISLKQSYNQLFRLVENYNKEDSKYKIILKSLPVPDIRTISALPKEESIKENTYSEIFIN